MTRVARRSVLPGFRLTLGFTLFYLCLIVLLPLLTLPPRDGDDGWSAIWQTISDPRVVASYRLSVGAALAAAAVNARVRPHRRVGARALPVSRQADRRCASSICRSRCRPPSPASR